MRDYLAWRLAFGVTTPSTNTVVQPEYDDLRPPGVTNHLARMVIPDDPVASDADLEKQLEAIDKSLEDAVDRVMDAKPNAFILGISALSVWGGTLEWGEELKRRVRKVAGWEIPVSIASDAVVAGLQAHGVKRRIAIMEPYYPCIEPRLNAVLGAPGYEIVRFCHMRGKSPASYSVLSAQDMIKAARSIDGPDVEAIVAFGANLPFARLADEAERWLDKPVLQINATTYWHALRTNGITDKVYGYGSLLARFLRRRAMKLFLPTPAGGGSSEKKEGRGRPLREDPAPPGRRGARAAGRTARRLAGRERAPGADHAE